MIGITYLIGCFIALILGLRLLYKEKNNNEINTSVINSTSSYNVLDFCIFNIMENTR